MNSKRKKGQELTVTWPFEKARVQTERHLPNQFFFAIKQNSDKVGLTFMTHIVQPIPGTQLVLEMEIY